MPKRREPVASAPTTEQVEAFASGANTAPKQLDPSAPHDFKALSVGLNEYEYRILEAASLKVGRSKLNFIRHAVLTLAKEVEPN